MKDRQSKMLIRKITRNGLTHFKSQKQSKIFTKNLYKKKGDLEDITTQYHFFKDLPKLDETDKENLAKPITLEELQNALKTCADSAPWMDGITYDSYKELWEITGQLIKQAWHYSSEVEKKTSQSQKISVITLLEKKDKSKIENL